MISIKDIAAECGVSIATVSKALNDHNDVSEATKKHIRDVSKEMGYLPNSQARALKTNRTFNLGVLFVDAAESGLTHNYFASVLDAFKVEAERMGYDITFISNNIDTLKMTYYEHCKYRNVDGVVIACVDFTSHEVIDLINSELPVVTIDYNSQKKLSILSDNADGMKQLVEYIYSMGHKKIAYICGDNSEVSLIRQKSYQDTLRDLNIEFRDDYLIQGKFHDPVITEECTKKLLLLDEPPTCIITPDDFSAIGTINAIDGMGLSLPGDISIAGYDGIFLSQVLKPKLTTLKQNTKSLGKEAAKQLISVIRKELKYSVAPTIISGKLIKGESIKDLRNL